MRVTHALSLSIIFIAAMSTQAHAYIDPGSGSVITTAIIGFFSAAAYTFRKYFYRLKDALFGRNSAKQPAGRDDA